MPPGVSVNDIPGNRPEDEAAERIYELEEALKPFALAFLESSPVGSIPDEKVWIWKPSDNRRETNGINRAHLKTAYELTKQP